MARYAIVENGIVVNIAESDKPLFPNWILREDANFGDTYDGVTYTKVVRGPVEIKPEPTVVEKLESLGINIQELKAELSK